MVSGKSREFLFGTQDSAGDIAQFVFDTWPEGGFSQMLCDSQGRHVVTTCLHCHHIVDCGVAMCVCVERCCCRALSLR